MIITSYKTHTLKAFTKHRGNLTPLCTVPIHLSSLHSSRGTEEPLSDPPAILGQVFFNKNPWQHCSDEGQPWLFGPSCSRKQRQKVTDGDKEGDWGGGGQRGRDRTGGQWEGWKIQRNDWGIMGRCLSWRLWGETFSTDAAKENKERRVMALGCGPFSNSQPGPPHFSMDVTIPPGNPGQCAASVLLRNIPQIKT